MIKFVVKKILNYLKNKKRKNNAQFISKLLNGNKIRLLDIGAAGGIQEIWSPYKNNIDQILFEPHLSSYEILKKKNYKVINKGLWIEKKLKHNFFLTKKPECSGILEPNYEYLNNFPNPERFKIIKTENIETTTLDDEFNSKNCPHFIKIDTEGAELKILKGGESILDNVLGLVVECFFFNLHKDQCKFEDVKNYLESKNIQFIDFLNMIRWERHRHSYVGQPQVSNVLFLVPPEKIIEKYNSKKLDLNTLKIYVTILYVFNRSDLIKVLIEHLDLAMRLNLYLEEAYNLTEKKVKRADFIAKMYWFYFNWLH